MKLNGLVLTIISTLYSAIAVGAPAESARSYIIGISPNLSERDRAEVYQQVGHLVLEGSKPGDEIVVFDALNLHEITRFAIPNEPVMVNNPTARARRLKAPFTGFQQFIKSPPAFDGAIEGAMLEPQFIELAARQLRPHGMPLTLILIGSALYVHPSDPAWNFDGNRYPSDGHIGGDRRQTPFGTGDRSRALEGIAVYHAYLRDTFATDAYLKAVTRWWSLWVSAQDGVLAGFAADLRVVMNSARRGDRQSVLLAQPDPKDDKVLMHQTKVATAQAEKAQNWIMADASEQRPPEGLANSVVRDFKLGIRWRDRVDVDLYCRPASGKKELYFNCSRSPEGFHEKDFVSAPPSINGFETVTFNCPVDLREATAALNLYSGDVSTSVEVEVRIWCDGQTYSRLVKIPATKGNRGLNGNSRETDPHWLVLDLMELVGLRTP